MSRSKSAARWIAGFLLLMIGLGPVVNFGLVGDAFHAPGGFLVNAAAHAFNVRLAFALDLLLASAALAIAIAAWPVIRAQGERFAVTLVALGAACLVLGAVENIGIQSMLSLSQAYAGATSPDPALYEALRGSVAATRNWSHYTRLVFMSAFFFALFAALFRFTLVPRLLAGFGMLGAVLQAFTVGRPLFGYPVIFPLLWPIGMAMLALAGWLLVKGIRQQLP